MPMIKSADLGSGLAGKGQRTLPARRAYNKYRIDAEMNGSNVLSFEEWAKKNGYDIVKG